MHCFNPEDQNDRVCIDLHKRSTTEELIERVISTRSGEAYTPATLQYPDECSQILSGNPPRTLTSSR